LREVTLLPTLQNNERPIKAFLEDLDLPLAEQPARYGQDFGV